MSTTSKPTEPEESAHSPPPTVGDPEKRETYSHGSTLTRRQAMQAAGAAIATLGLAGLASADDNDGDDPFMTRGQFYNGLGMAVGAGAFPPLAILFAAKEFERMTNEEPSADQIVLHNQAMRANEWWDNIYTVVFDNRLVDAKMAAHIAGRNALADSWEDGATPAQGYENVLQTFEEFYDVPARNITETLWTALEEIGYVSAVARTDEDIPSRFVAFTPRNDDYSGSGVIVDEGDASYIDNELVDNTVTLPSGYEHTGSAPELHVEWDNGDSLTIRPDDDLLDYYDPEEGMFVDVPTEQNETVDFHGRITVYAVPEHDLKPETVLDLSEWADYLDQIDDHVGELKANYDEAWVHDLFDALDQGIIDVEMIRGVEGMAEHLSGSTDATESRFQMALAALLDLERPDLSEVASMTLEYTGWTNRAVHRDDGIIEVTDHEDGLQIEGQFFSDLHGDTKLSPDTKLAANPVLLVPDYDGLHLLDYATGAEYWRKEPNTDVVDDASISRCGRYAAIGHKADELILYDARNGDELWVESGPNSVTTAEIAPDSSGVLGSFADWDRLSFHDIEDGSIIWERTMDGRVHDAQFLDGGDTILISQNGVAHLIEADSGDDIWQEDLTDFVRSFAVSPDGSRAIFWKWGEDVTKVIDLSDGSVIWEETGLSFRGFLFHPDGDLVYQIDDDQVTIRDADDGTVIDTESVPGADMYYPILGPGGQTFITTGSSRDLWVIDIDTFEIIEHHETDGNLFEPQLYPHWDDVDGVVARGLAFDGPSGESYSLTRGIIEIDTLTTSDGEELPDDWEGDWDRPEYDEQDNEEYREYIERVIEEHVEVIDGDGDGDGDGDDDGSIGLPSFGNPFEEATGTVLLGVAIIAAAFVAIVAFVTDLLPWTN